jgi:hypothetical protein
LAPVTSFVRRIARENSASPTRGSSGDRASNASHASTASFARVMSIFDPIDGGHVTGRDDIITAQSVKKLSSRLAIRKYGSPSVGRASAATLYERTA